ncbi:hypothetical protein PHLGIDRAFT_115528 [Phlebiopsis gigantea 11061_1 CR5-6]|uniref:Uncharacterized protein n=1 Tax=Phlebiopsis gigantea (strain 11061_1 CR5-6) TaxID=745531 RepID=A0A0C3SED4_PHLG1|nr:hypothetical protein PHLGIDRAFT_115528 [Phlebiopsis gigantea 11061_1 CR5-6]
MAGSMESLSGPNYISSHSADVILSDVRPIKLKLEALRSVNVLLDEFLYKILSTGGALTTDKLKNGLGKVLPTSLGKAAVLEAEVELQAYWERNTPHTPNMQEFDLQWSFELLRLKCEAYTTMNDLDEDEESERRLTDRMLNAGSTTQPHKSLVAPAALYLTAILEHICEHILSNVGRVAARDSSRTVATVRDLFVALCEDASVYSAFKTMKVYDQIDALSKVQKPRRSKSTSKSVDSGSFSASRATSPPPEMPSPAVRSNASPPPRRMRASSDSAGSFASTVLAAASTRSSGEKSRRKLFSRDRSSFDQDRSSDITESVEDDTRTGNSFEMMDEEALREFDELMQSGTTMKVSLTPDRLKSMEVYKQEKRKPRATGEETPAEVEVKRAVSVRRVQARLVDAITEDEEPTMSIKAPPSPVLNVITPRTRQTSLNATSPPTPTSNPRSRTITLSVTQASQKKTEQGRTRPSMPSAVQRSGVRTPKREDSGASSIQLPQDGRPPRTRKVARNRESLDLDDVMGLVDDDDDDAKTIPQTPASRQNPSKPYISKSARDLIDFLDEGPPLETLQRPNRNPSMISLESSKSRSGRLHRMMSKLNLGGSGDKLSGKAESVRSLRSPSSAIATSPPPSFMQTPASLRGPTVIVATPPPPPASLSLSAALSSYMTPERSPPQQQPQPQTQPQPRPEPVRATAPSPTRRMSITRKPVPAWDERQDTLRVLTSGQPQQGEQPSEKSSRRASPNRKSSSSKRTTPLDAFPPVPTTVNVNGVVHDSDSDVIRRASMASTKRYTPIRSDFPSPSTPSPPLHPSPSPSIRLALESPLATTPASGSPIIATSPLVCDSAPEVNNTSWPPTPPSSSRDITILDSALDAAEASAAENAVAADAPAFTAEQAQDLRRLLSVATTADECRLLVDMFLIKSGFPLPSAKDEEVAPAPAASKEVEQIASKIETFNEDIERSLVFLLLGDGESELDVLGVAATA